MGLALGIALNPYASFAKELKLKVRKCGGLIRTFVEITGEILLGRGAGEGGMGGFFQICEFKFAVT